MVTVKNRRRAQVLVHGECPRCHKPATLPVPAGLFSVIAASGSVSLRRRLDRLGDKLQVAAFRIGQVEQLVPPGKPRDELARLVL